MEQRSQVLCIMKFHGFLWCKYIFLSDELTILPLLKLNHHKGSEEVKLSTRYSIFTLTWQNRKEETHKPLLVKEILTYLCTLTHLYRRLDYSHVNCSWKWIVRNKSSLVSWLLAAIHFLHGLAPCLRQYYLVLLETIYSKIQYFFFFHKKNKSLWVFCHV